MGHIPYGYRIENGKAVVEPKEAESLIKMCEGYLGGLSLKAAAEGAGINATHCQAKRMMLNKKYLGTDYYPAILTGEMVEQVKTEIENRATRLGRNFAPKERERKKAAMAFAFEKGEFNLTDPYSKAELAYSLIKEVPMNG